MAGSTVWYSPSGVKMAAKETNATLPVCSHMATLTRLCTPCRAAASVWRMVGHSDEWRNRLSTDLIFINHTNMVAGGDVWLTM